MEDVDLSKRVMDKVVKLERRRVALWQLWFWVVVGALVLIVVVSLVRAVQIIQARGTLDLLTLFQEDFETIAEFWQDSLATFFEELPHRRLVITFLIGGVTALVFLVTKRTRKILRKKIDQLRQFGPGNG